MPDMGSDHYKIGGMGADIYKIGPMGDDEYLIGPAETPSHGKLAAIYRQRPNNFKGSGLNDMTIGAWTVDSDSSYLEFVIDANGTPDTFKWRENGGSWTSGVAITGSAQTVAGTNGTQSVTFAATTGHTINDQWAVGNLTNEPCTESGAIAQITDADLRILNLNSLPTFTDGGGATVLIVDPTRGRATFNANVGAVTVSGDNGFILRSGLEQMGYLIDWSAVFSVAMADASRAGQEWTEALPGQGGGSGSAAAYFIGSKSLITELTDHVDGTQEQFFVELFTFDPQKDQSGDHLQCWATITGLDVSAPLNAVVTEPISFQLQSIPNFIGND